MGRRLRFPRTPKGLFQLEALAVGALDLGGIGLVGAHLNAVQAAVVGVLAVIGAVVDGALDALVGRAVVSHDRIPPA